MAPSLSAQYDSPNLEVTMWRRVDEWTMIHPVRGKAPEPPPGFQATGAPFVATRSLLDCEHRMEKVSTTCSRCMQLWCDYFLKEVNREKCYKCEIPVIGDIDRLLDDERGLDSGQSGGEGTESST